MARLGNGAGSERWSLDTLRSLLIAAGELEQALEDHLPEHLGAAAAEPALRLARASTRYLAGAFSARFRGLSVDPLNLSSAAAALAGLRKFPDVPVTVKVPEGFQFYLLYTEQYVLAALQWDAAQGSRRQDGVLVVGVRTIGTPLSAVVAANLQDQGWKCIRTTVRPNGPPFERQVELDPGLTALATAALVVDEGPGLSGSSMAAVAAALVRSGMDPGRISFLPGHAGEPGTATSDTTRRWWSQTPRFVGRREDLRWNGSSLSEVLAMNAEAFDPERGPVVEVQDLGGGLWRPKVYPSAEDWPPAAVPFEAPKFRCVRADGSAVLWKFAGLASSGGAPAAETTRLRLERLAREGWSAAPLGTCLGFVALPWVEASPMRRSELDGEHLRRMAGYLSAAAGPPLSPAEYRTAFERLGEVLFWNVWEDFDLATAERCRELQERAGSVHESDLPATYGDGRMAPHEWLRTPDGRILKADAAGHTADHTAIGVQSLAWDVAGVVVEWELVGEGLRCWLNELGAHGHRPLSAPLLDFYRAAYAAFRLGLWTQCDESASPDAAEARRLSTEMDRMRRHLLDLLSVV